MRMKRRDHADAEIAADFQHRPLVGEKIDHGADVIDAQAVFRDRPPQQPLVRRLPVGHRALKIGQIFLRGGGCLRFVLDEDVDDAVRRLERHRPDFGRMIDAEPAAFDHRRTAHADRRILGRDDHVAAAEHRGIAGEAIAGDDADHRHQSGQLGELHEGRPVEAGHAEPVGIAGTAAAALGVEHQRQPPLLGEPKHAVDLLVVHVALGARQHGVVIGDHHAAGAFRAEFFRVHGGDARNQPVGGRVHDEVIDLAPAALGGDRERAVFDERTVIDEVRDVFARGALIGLAPPLDRGRPVFIERDGVAGDQFGQIGADVIEIDILFFRRRHGHRSRPVRETGSPRPASGSRRHPRRSSSPCRHAARSPDAPSSWIRAPRSAGRGGRGRLR